MALILSIYRAAAFAWSALYMSRSLPRTAVAHDLHEVCPEPKYCPAEHCVQVGLHGRALEYWPMEQAEQELLLRALEWNTDQRHRHSRTNTMYRVYSSTQCTRARMDPYHYRGSRLISWVSRPHQNDDCDLENLFNIHVITNMTFWRKITTKP